MINCLVNRHGSFQHKNINLKDALEPGTNKTKTIAMKLFVNYKFHSLKTACPIGFPPWVLFSLKCQPQVWGFKSLVRLKKIFRSMLGLGFWALGLESEPGLGLAWNENYNLSQAGARLGLKSLGARYWLPGLNKIYILYTKTQLFGNYVVLPDLFGKHR